MGIRLWPNDYEKLPTLMRGERKLMRFAERNFVDGHFFINLNPMHFFPDKHMGMYISPSDGLLTFLVSENEIKLDAAQAYINLVERIEKLIVNRLADSKVLIARNGEKKILRFPYKHLLIFPNQDKFLTSTAYSDRVHLNNFVAVGAFRPMDSTGMEKSISQLHIFNGVRQKFDNEFSGISNQQVLAIIERLAPEYAVVLPERDSTEIVESKTVVTDEDLSVSGNEAEYKTFCLDPYQVSLVNDMGRGHRVVLANPGSGKSVILLARAFRYSGVFQNSKILITCYNNNLAELYRFKEACAGFKGDNNLYIFTFHKLVVELLREVNVQITSSFPEEQDITNCYHLIRNGMIKTRFKAIFVDEVQIFTPLFLEICYYLLETGEDSSFILTGDLNQTVRRASRRGDVPWKKMPDVTLDFKGRVKYIDKNYRNSFEISKYLKKMLKLMNDRFEMFHLINSSEYDYNQFKLGEGRTISLKVFTGIDRSDIKNKVIMSIKEIHSQYRISYSDIAVIFPYRKHNSFKYYIKKWIEDGLISEGIEYSIIFRNDDDLIKTSYSKTSGVVLSTIDSSLGLDFKAVIVCGLYPLGFVINSNNGRTSLMEIKSWTSIGKMSDQEKEKVQEQIRKIYTACSRARDVLYVISDLKNGTPMSEIVAKPYLSGGFND